MLIHSDRETLFIEEMLMRLNKAGLRRRYAMKQITSQERGGRKRYHYIWFHTLWKSDRALTHPYNKWQMFCHVTCQVNTVLWCLFSSLIKWMQLNLSYEPAGFMRTRNHVILPVFNLCTNGILWGTTGSYDHWFKVPGLLVPALFKTTRASQVSKWSCNKSSDRQPINQPLWVQEVLQKTKNICTQPFQDSTSVTEVLPRL